MINLQLAYGNTLTDRERRRLAREVFENLATTLIEILRMDQKYIDERVEVVGIEHALAAIQRGKGFIGAGGHLGNWEIIGGLGRLKGIDSAMVVRPVDNPFIEQELQRCRQRYVTRVVPRDLSSMRETLKRLRSGLAVGIAIDLNTYRHPVFVDFMGVPASTAKGAAKMARQEDVPVFLIVPIRRPGGKHQLILDPVPMQRTEDEEADIRANMQALSDRWAFWIHQYPEQWQWQHARWRNRPDGFDWTLSTPIQDMVACRTKEMPRPCLPWERNEAKEHTRHAA